MAQITIGEALGRIKDNLFHVSEKERLKKMQEHQSERERTGHGDFLSMVHGECETGHGRRMEHHGAEFWTYYYAGERPEGVLGDKEIGEHEYGTYQQRLSIETHMLDEKFAEFVAPDTRASEEALVQGHWVTLVWIGEAALEKERLKEAESNFRQALVEAEKFGEADARLSRTLTGLAKSLCAQGRHDESDGLYKKALSIDEKLQGKHNRNLEEDFTNFARHYLLQGKYAEAERVYRDALSRWEQALGPEDPCIARCLNDLAVVCCQQRKCEEAEGLYERALAILEKAPVLRKQELATALQNLATLYVINGRDEEALIYYGRAAEVLEQ